MFIFKPKKNLLFFLTIVFFYSLGSIANSNENQNSPANTNLKPTTYEVPSSSAKSEPPSFVGNAIKYPITLFKTKVDGRYFMKSSQIFPFEIGDILTFESSGGVLTQVKILKIVKTALLCETLSPLIAFNDKSKGFAYLSDMDLKDLSLSISSPISSSLTPDFKHEFNFFPGFKTTSHRPVGFEGLTETFIENPHPTLLVQWFYNLRRYIWLGLGASYRQFTIKKPNKKFLNKDDFRSIAYELNFRYVPFNEPIRFEIPFGFRYEQDLFFNLTENTRSEWEINQLYLKTYYLGLKYSFPITLRLYFSAEVDEILQKKQTSLKISTKDNFGTKFILTFSYYFKNFNFIVQNDYLITNHNTNINSQKSTTQSIQVGIQKRY